MKGLIYINNFKSIKYLLVALIVTFSFQSSAQTDPLIQAKMALDQKDFKKAKELFQDLMQQTPNDAEVFEGYLLSLKAMNEFKAAEKLLLNSIKERGYAPLLYIELGQVYSLWGKEKKASESYEFAVQSINGDDMMINKMANQFIDLKLDIWAIKTYERGIELMNSNFYYGVPLAKLYGKIGAIDKAVDVLLSIGQIQIPGVEDTKATLLTLLGNDPQKLQMAQKALLKQINQQPQNTWFIDILTWLYIQKNDWDGALLQMQALDERLGGEGQKTLDFSRLAKREGQFKMALSALQSLLDKGKNHPIYAAAFAEQLNCLMLQLGSKPDFNKTEIDSIEVAFEQYFNEFPQRKNTDLIRDYARLEAQFAAQPRKAIQLLEATLQQPGGRKDFMGWVKLELGDYYILTNKIWDASLLYSQVDKDFREDQLGEEARFRNAKLSFYNGDFEWAQGQLNVLKASTSELIANDALSLSVLITENIPPDSNLVPLRRFAYADLLVFQNKDSEAEVLLDSILTNFPKHPLEDDIMLQLAKINIKHRDYRKALDRLNEIYLKHGKDVLADDALFLSAKIYEQNFKDNLKAKEYYEKIVLDFPGSTFVQSARNKLSNL